MNCIGLRHICLVRRIASRMSSTNSSYEDAIQKLNSLQSNKSTIEQIKRNLKFGQKCTNIEDMENYLGRIGIPMAKLDELSVIHVAGTKGKGSTSAMCESILRRHGFRTGFYSSPHLVAARERVRLDGRPLAEDSFAAYLHHVYGLLRNSQEFEGDMPKYFAFLTVMAFHVFLMEKVDVAIVEVGIGGVVDYTNVLRKVPVVGITALGLDHTSILGNTLPEIAAAKAGIMKRGCEAYTVQQPKEALDVLVNFAGHVKCPLTVVPDYTSYIFPKTEESHLPVDLEAYRTNASLAIQLSHAWIRVTQAITKQNGFASLINKGHNGLTNGHAKILNGFQYDGTNKDQNANTSKDQNALTNGHVKISNGSANKDQNASQNGNTSKDQNALTNGHVNISNGNTNKDQNASQNSNTSKDQNALTNGHVKISNGSTNKDQNSNTSKDQNALTNGHVKISNGSTNKDQNASQNSNTSKDQNALTNGHVKISNGSTNKDQNSNTSKDQNALTNGIANISNGSTNKDGNALTNGNILKKLVYEVPYATVEGLRQCKWPGRYHVLEQEYAKFYLDGAHTKESMEICAKWFQDNSNSSEDTCLVFSATGDRNAETLLQPLINAPFKQIYFVIPTAQKSISKSHDNFSLVEQEELRQRCSNHAQIWRKNNSKTNVTVLECVADALCCIQKRGGKPSVLITGSLHLVGAALSILDPSLST